MAYLAIVSPNGGARRYLAIRDSKTHRTLKWLGREEGISARKLRAAMTEFGVKAPRQEVTTGPRGIGAV